jgi:hypothetical protein
VAEEAQRAIAKVQSKSVGAQKEEAIEALLRAPRLEAAAAMVGVDESLLRKWLDEPRFRARYEAACQAVVDDAVARLQQLAAPAVEALARNLSCGVPAVEIEAAKAVLAHIVTGADRLAPDGAGRKPGTRHKPGEGR